MSLNNIDLHECIDAYEATRAIGSNIYIDDPRGLNYGIIGGQRVGAFGLSGFITQADGLYEGLPPVGEFAPSQLTGLESMFRRLARRHNR